MNKDNPKISIIVPMYNCAEYAPKCIESVQNQKYDNWELLLIHGDSNDGTEAVCQSYEDKDSRIKNVFHIDGLVGARNVGYEMAVGDWQMYIDGDDWIADNTLEELVAYINKYADVDVVFWKVIHDLNGKSIKGKWEWPCKDEERLYVGDECIDLARNVLVYKSGIATAYCKLIRSDYAKKNNIKHDDRLRQGMEGTEFSMRVFYNAKKVLYVNKYYNFYRYNPDSMSKTVSERNAHCITDCVKVMEEDIDKYPQKEAFTKALYQRVTYALIAVAMSTYFHPANHDSLLKKVKKYSDYINGYKFYRKAIMKTSTQGMGKQRTLVVWLLRMKLYIALSLIARLKAFYLKKGKFDY